ncbi:hypothetical protein HOU74_gp24 [Pectobacterium phage Phoria]|uniref:Uncharacterized protein n=2 Tax=Phimunavirus TaxID=2560202 RepID=A0A385IFA3_9CAUD|nr:hypothetical protein HOU11_gp21 [Pectobacterium phage Gaspode]YP_009817289.1 hypothetical protein HOU74_gp24 [Pectobacterium phage Phoria]AXY81678.1 hypothetical protein [Pectobacterium phage Gaspode]AZF94930.1 hypothetical protein [Pectobacterium phage Phoria]
MSTFIKKATVKEVDVTPWDTGTGKIELQIEFTNIVLGVRGSMLAMHNQLPGFHGEQLKASIDRTINIMVDQIRREINSALDAESVRVQAGHIKPNWNVLI